MMSVLLNRLREGYIWLDVYYSDYEIQGRIQPKRLIYYTTEFIGKRSDR